MKDYLVSNAEMLISLIFPFCRQEFMLLLTIFCREVNLHKGGKSDPRGFVFKTPAHDHLVLVCFQAEMRSEFRCCSAAPFEKGYQADGCPDAMMDELGHIAYVLIWCLYTNFST